jgi:hypothetical protein
MITITLTEQQAVNLRGLIDLAVKAGGSRIMREAVEIDDLVMRAAQASQEVAQQAPAKKNGEDAHP